MVGKCSDFRTINRVHDLHRLRRAAQIRSSRSARFHSTLLKSKRERISYAIDELGIQGQRESPPNDISLRLFLSGYCDRICFAKDYSIGFSRFQARFVKTMQELGKNMHLLMLFPRLLSILVGLPEWFVTKLDHQIGEIFAFQRY